MCYILEIHPKCKKEIKNACKKNQFLRKVLEKKMSEIIKNPYHYKPLKYELAGERRVHILKSFVLKFEINEAQKRICFIMFEHHDNVYNY
jgi:YafQ family addiction module toxin component